MAPVVSPPQLASSSSQPPSKTMPSTGPVSTTTLLKVYKPPHRTSFPPPPSPSLTSPAPNGNTSTSSTEPIRTSARPQAPKLQMPRPPAFPSRKSRALLTAYGDSFVGPLELLGDKVVVNKYSGASAKGLNNPKSVSQTGQELLFHMDRFRPSKVLLIFGHVDLQVVYLFKVSESERLGTAAPDPDAWVKTVWDAYKAYLQEKILPHVDMTSGTETDPDKFITQLYISSITAPTVPDDYLDTCSEKYNESAAAAWQEKGIKLGNARSPTDFATRRKMIVDFNRNLEEFCKESGPAVRYVDLNPRITDPVTGEVLPPYLVPDKSTIHVVWETTIGFWVDALRGSGLSEADIPEDLEESLKSYEEDKKGRMERRSPTPRKHMRYSSASTNTGGINGASAASASSPATPSQAGAPFGSTVGRDAPVRSPFGESSRGSAFAHMQPRKRDTAGDDGKPVYRPPHSRSSVPPTLVPISPTSAVSPTSALSPSTPGTAVDPASATGRPRSLGGRWTNVVPQDDPRRLGSFVHGYSSHRRQPGDRSSAAGSGSVGSAGSTGLEKPLRSMGLMDGPMGSIGARPVRGGARDGRDDGAKE